MGFETVMGWGDGLVAHFLYTHENVLPLFADSLPAPPNFSL